MVRLINRIFTTPPQARIMGLQLEISTLCQLSCLYCPRTQTKDWINAFMSWSMYEQRIAPYFDLFDMVYLQGWGEPLTNPYFWKMVELAKAVKRKVGFTTNGILLDELSIERACELEVDLISFTFTGATPSTHEFYRGGSNFNNLISKIRMLSDRKRITRKEKPTIGISFTMMRDNLHEFSDVAKLAIELGVNQITASHLDCISAEEMERHTVFLNPRLDDEQHIKNAAHVLQSSKAFFKSEPPQLSGEILVCEPNPLRTTVFVQVDGTVVPCHQMALPKSIVKSIYYRGMKFDYDPIILGNVQSEKLSDILNNDASKELRNTFGLRQDGINTTAALGQSIPDAPLICQKCYKLYGV